MAIITENKKKIAKLFLFFLLLIYIVSLKQEILLGLSLSPLKRFINVFVILFVMIMLLIDSFKLFRKKQAALIEWDVFFWVGWVFLSILFFITIQYKDFNFLPLFYILNTSMFAFFSVKVSLFYMLITIFTQFLYMCIFPWQRDYVSFSFFTIMLIIFSLFGYLLKKERKEKLIYETKLTEIKEGAKAFFSRDEVSFEALKEDKRIEYLQSTFGFFEERVFKILQQVKELMEPYTVAFFKIKEDGKTYKIFEAISDSDYLRYNDDISLEEGVVGWIFKHEKSLNFSSVKGGSRVLNYYDTDLPIASFLGIPVFWRNKIVGVLAVDSLQDNAFNPDSENIVKLAVLQIQEAMENVQLIQQMQMQYREFSALYDGSKRMMKCVTLEENLNTFLDIINTITHNDVSIIALIDEMMEHKLVIKSSRGLADDVINKKVEDESLLLWVVNHKQYLDLRHYDAKKKIKPIIATNIKFPKLQRVIIYPLGFEDRVLGALMLGYKDEGPDDYEKRIIEILTNQACVSISNATLFEQVQRMATTDGLTGVYNHRHFQEKFNEILMRAERYNEKFSLILIDIDFFKKVNDTYGHQVGDIVLKKVAQTLQQVARKVDIVARYGGEEFAIICVNDDKRNSAKLAERIRKEIENLTIVFEGGKLKVTASLGVASFPEDGKDKVSIVESADRALYEAKHSGRNRVVIA